MTGRLPFDPGKMRGAPPAADAAVPTPSSLPAAPRSAGPASPAPTEGGPGSAKPMSVSMLAQLISGALERLPQTIRVVGEVSGFRDRTHWYFDLKDADAVVNCVMFASAARKAGFVAENGQSVVATGRVEFYAKGGKVSFLCQKLEPVGAGALELAFRRLVEEIRALGWFDPGRKRRLPAFPRRIAVVTSRTGAALQDVLDTAKRRCPAVEIAVVDVRVQGERAAPEVAAAINWLGQHHERLGLDALLITRGGGSMEDLWAFNEKQVAAAIVSCPIPVVAAIGHETDTTIAELVADERCATPTQAAMRLIPDRLALAEQTDSLADRLAAVVDRLVAAERRRVDSHARHLGGAAMLAVARARSRVDRVGVRLEQQRPAAAQARREARLAEAERRLRAAMRSSLERQDVGAAGGRLAAAMGREVRRQTEALAALERTLAAVSPLRVLARGYSVTTRADGRAVRSPTDVEPGDTLHTRLADGLVRSVVEGDGARTRAAANEPARDPGDSGRDQGRSDSARTKPSPRRPARENGEAPGLFG